MALPTTNLTAHFDATQVARVFENDAGTDTAEDGDNINLWQDEDGFDLALWYRTTAAEGPTYRSGGSALMAGANADFNGDAELLAFYNNAGSTQKGLSDLVGLGAKTIALAVYIEGITTNAANPWDNEAILAESAQLFGIFLKTSGGVHTLYVYNWDGNADTISTTVSLNTSYVIIVRHDGTNLNLRVNSTDSSPVASGNTTGSGSLFLGCNGSGSGGVPGTANFNGRIGEIAIYNTALTGTPLTDANSYFTSKWLAAGAYTLTATGTTYNYTGQAVSLLRKRALAASGTTYNYTGQAVSLLRKRALTASGTTYPYTGQVMTPLWKQIVTASGTTYNYTGQAVTFNKGRSLAATGATYTYTGQAVSLLWKQIVSAQGTTFNYTGQAVNLIYTPLGAFLLTADGAVYSYTGQNVSLLWKQVIAANGAVFNYTGQDVSLVFSGEVTPPAGVGRLITVTTINSITGLSL